MEKTIRIISVILTLIIIGVVVGGVAFYGLKPITEVPWFVIVCTVWLIFKRRRRWRLTQ